MKTARSWIFWAGAISLGSVGLRLPAAEVAGGGVPPLVEIYSAVQGNLAGVSEESLNRAAVMGFLSQLKSQVTLVTNAAQADTTSAIPLIIKSTVFDGAYGFVRIGRVGPGLAGEVNKAYEQLSSSNKLKGLIVDLRFAIGYDYAAAADTADLFFKTEQPLLQWGETKAHSKAKATAIDLPLVLLVNHDTTGAAEALAAVLRQMDGALLIGSPTAGRAFLFKEVPLSTGQVLRVASGQVATGNGQELPKAGLVPDIRITVNPEDEKAYFEDPYRTLAKPFAQVAKPATNDSASVQSTNRARRRLNEAELVRMQREGMDLEGDSLPANPGQGTAIGGPVIIDPALSRGLDLLKGLALAAKRR
jgi:hypothetical protein